MMKNKDGTLGENFALMVEMNCTGVLLCGGKSRRMGFDKAFLQHEGGYLLAQHAQRLEALFGRVLAVAETPTKFAGHPALAALPTVGDHYPETGPLGAVCTAFEETETPWLFVMACDMPTLDENILHKMMKKIQDVDIVVCQAGGKMEPLFAFYHRRCLPVLQQQLQKRELRLRAGFSQLRVAVLEEGNFANWNTPEDVARWQAATPPTAEVLPLLPALVMVGGHGRNDGKTALACALVAQLKGRVPVWGLKVICVEEPGRPCHRGQGGCGLCGGLDGPYDLTEETNRGTEKDTALLLKAGAEKAFLLRSRPQSMAEAMAAFWQTVPRGTAVVCESNRMRHAVRPGVFLFAARVWPPTEEGKPGAAALAGLAGQVVQWGQPPPTLTVEKTGEGALTIGLAAPRPSNSGK